MNDSKWNPKISIIIPVYNGGDYLGQALHSALAQTYSHFEIIVVNDGSNDGGETDKIARSFGTKIRYFSKENGGVASALNLGIENMEGEYMSWLSHDDIYYPNKLEEQIEFLEGKSKKTIAYSDFTLIDNNSQLIGKQVIYFKPKSDNRLNLLFFPQIHGCTTLIPKACFDEIGFFNEKLKYTQDYDFWYRASAQYDFVYCPHFLVMSRHHERQGSVQNSVLLNNERKLLYQKIIQEEYLADLIDVPMISKILVYLVGVKDLETFCIVFTTVKTLVRKFNGALKKYKLWMYLILSFIKELGNLIYIFCNYKIEKMRMKLK